MAMYAIGIIPLIQYLGGDNLQQVWYADDGTAGAKIVKLREWWDHLLTTGPDYVYHPNTSKTWPIVKEDKYDNACKIFDGTGVNITIEGRRLLGGALGTCTFLC